MGLPFISGVDVWAELAVGVTPVAYFRSAVRGLKYKQKKGVAANLFTESRMVHDGVRTIAISASCKRLARLLSKI